MGDNDKRPCDKLNGCIGKSRKYSAMSMKAHGETYFLTGFLRSGNTTGSPVLVVVVRGEDLVEGVSPAMGAPLFKRAETRFGVGACFFVAARPPAVGSLHVCVGGKKRWQLSDNKLITALEKKTSARNG